MGPYLCLPASDAYNMRSAGNDRKVNYCQHIKQICRKPYVTSNLHFGDGVFSAPDVMVIPA